MAICSIIILKKLGCDEIKFFENLEILLYYNIILMLIIKVVWYKLLQQYHNSNVFFVSESVGAERIGWLVIYIIVILKSWIVTKW